MINLPRKLVYAGRTSLSDFTEGNELNREICAVLSGYLRFHSGYFSPVDPDRQERQMVEIFNYAYYYAVLAVNDRAAFGYFRNMDRSGDALIGFDVALVILALQKDKDEKVRKILKRFMRRLNPLLNDVLVKFKSEDKVYCLDFSPCPPEANQLDMEWEEVTDSFNRDRMVKILSLWKTKDEKKKVLHQIWTSAMVFQEESSHSEACMYIKMLQGALDDTDGELMNAATFYATVIGRLNKENATLKEEKAVLQAQSVLGTEGIDRWVRWVVNYAKDRHTWEEARPFRDMLDKLLRGSTDHTLFDMVDEIERHFHERKKEADVNVDKAGNVFINTQNVNNHG